MQIWEVDSGRQMYQIMEAHGPTNEVTCCAVNGRGTKMVSGAADGKIFILNH